MMADLFCHERAAAFEQRVRELRAQAPEPGIPVPVTPVEVERRSILALLCGRVAW